MTATAWTPSAMWSVPKEWTGERCFIVCSGESVGLQVKHVARLKGRIIAVKHGVLLRPDADVLFISGERCATVAAELVPVYRGPRVVLRGRADEDVERNCETAGKACLRVGRSKLHGTLTDTANLVTGLDTGTSAIHLAYLFGATEIVLLGYDMTGGHFVANHPLPYPPKEHFVRHTACLPALAEDAKRKGVRIVNCSPISRVTAFERRRLEEYL